jgi:hypothetical protein
VKDALLGSVATEIVRLPAQIDVSHQQQSMSNTSEARVEAATSEDACYRCR